MNKCVSADFKTAEMFIMMAKVCLISNFRLKQGVNRSVYNHRSLFYTPSMGREGGLSFAPQLKHLPRGLALD